MARPWMPYAWEAIERVPRALARRARGDARALRHTLDPVRIAPALAELIEAEVSLHVKSAAARVPLDELAGRLALELGAGIECELRFPAELAAELLTRALRRPFRLSAPAELSEILAGALAALAVETARRAGCEAPRLARGRDAATVWHELTLLVAGKPYLVVASLTAPPELAPRVPALAELGELTVSVPLVAALGLVERASLLDLVPGNAWFPGAGWWLDAAGKGHIALAAGSSDLGIRAELTDSGDLVLRGEAVDLAPDSGEPMSDSDTKTQTISQAVLDSPLVVRIELGAVSMTAREWAELAPGDIIASGRRVAEPVVLRVAGREVAHGELVNLEGELGVRIRELVRT